MPQPSTCVKLGNAYISSKELVEIAKSHKLNGEKYNALSRNCQMWCIEFCSEIPGLQDTNWRDVRTVLLLLFSAFYDYILVYMFFQMGVVVVCTDLFLVEPILGLDSYLILLTDIVLRTGGLFVSLEHLVKFLVFLIGFNSFLSGFLWY